MLGPNGAGKTTTIQMICGVVAPSAAEITVGDFTSPGKGGTWVWSSACIGLVHAAPTTRMLDAAIGKPYMQRMMG